MDISDTETQNVNSQMWANMESQPIDLVVWGRIYPKNAKMKSLDLNKESFTIGRDRTNDLSLTLNEFPMIYLKLVSKVHFKICKDLTQESNPVYIYDLSRNGTFINGDLIGFNKKQILLNNDTISVSHKNFKAFVYKSLCHNDTQGLPTNVVQQYHIGYKLGAGACGMVRLVYDRKTCLQYAMKGVQKNLFLVNSANDQCVNNNTRIMNEANIMKALNHPCIIKMHEIIDNPDTVIIMLELMRGGDLLNRITEKKFLPEKLAKLYFLQMCDALEYLHSKNITHRDLKPDNILLENKNDETLLKLSDFGLSKFVRDNSALRTICGTLTYVAPEILMTQDQKTYTNKVDIWSLGVVLYSCLSGTLPFSINNGHSIVQQIKNGFPYFRGSVWNGVSTEAKSLIGLMLTVDPKKRPPIRDILKHPWLQDSEIHAKAQKIMNKNIRYTYREREVFKPPPPKRRRVQRK